MALSGNARAERKLVDQFLAGDGAQASGFLGTLNQDINTNKQARRAAQQGARGQATLGRGLERMRSIGGTPILNPNPSTVTIPGLNPQVGAGGGGLPAVQDVTRGQRVGGPTIGPSPGARPMGPIPQGIPATTGATTQIGPAGNPGAIPQVRPQGVGGGAMGSAARTAASEADDFVRIAGEAAVQGSDDAARAAASSAGRSTATAVAQGSPNVLRQTATNLGVNITKGGLMRGGGIAAGGVLASQFIDGMNIGGEQSVLDKGGSAAILGAGLGGGAAIALGLGAGPAGWAALGGAALFGAGRALFGGDDTKLETATKTVAETRDTITELGAMYGIEGDAMQDIMLQYEASTSMMLQNKDTAGLKDFIAGLGTQLPALMLQAREQMKTEGQETERFNTMMAAQAQFAPIFERTLDRASQASQTAYQTANGAANYLDQRQPQLAALYRQTAAQSQASAANLQAAYAKQMATAPVTTGTTDQLQRQLAQEELMAQQLQMAGGF